MLKSRAIAVVVIIAVMLSGAVFAQDKTIAQLASETPELSTLVSLVEAAGITLSGTVYAPTNEAFAAWPQFVTDYVTANPELLAAVLSYHVAGEAGPTVVTAADGTVWVDNAQVIGAETAASDGVLSIIDTVLIPPVELPEVIPADVTGDINLAGSSTVFPISQAVAAAFADEGFGGEITADSIGTGAGFERFCAAEGASDISNASRPIRDAEIEACAANNQRVPVGFRVGDDGLAVVVNPANDWASELTLAEIALAFSTAATWADVRPGFPECDIVRFSPGTDSGTFDYFVEEIFDEDEAPILAASNINLSEDDNILLDGVANNECAIGYFGYAYFSENADRVSTVAVEGVQPTAESVNGGTYPLSRPLFIYSASSILAEKPQVGLFLAYYLNRVPDITPEVGYFLPNPFDFNASKLVLLALIHEASMGGM